MVSIGGSVYRAAVPLGPRCVEAVEYMKAAVSTGRGVCRSWYIEAMVATSAAVFIDRVV